MVDPKKVANAAAPRAEPIKQTRLRSLVRDFEVLAAASDLRAAIRFADTGSERRLLRGARLLEEGDKSEHVYFLTKGLVGVFHSAEDGAHVLVKVFGPPSIFGEMEIPFDLARMEYVEVLEDCEFTQFEGALFLDFLRRDAGAAYAMFKDVSARLCVSAYLERALAFQDVATRTAGLFLSLIDLRTHDSDQPTIPFQLSYTMIARCLGTATKSVERTIGKWTRDGWLERNNGLYRILDMSALRAVADPNLLLLHTRLGRRPTQL